MNRRARRIFSLCCLLCAAPVQADIYAREDGEGTLHLTDTPVGDGYELLLEARATGAPADARRTAARPAAAAAHQQRIARVANRTGVEAGLLNAVIAVESAYNPKAVSPKGAAGLMQLMPDTARRYGVLDRFDPDQNLLGGALYLRDLMARFDNRLDLALAAYNAGEGAVERHGRRVPPFAETLRYVPKVLDHYRSLR